VVQQGPGSRTAPADGGAENGSGGRHSVGKEVGGWRKARHADGPHAILFRGRTPGRPFCVHVDLGTCRCESNAGSWSSRSFAQVHLVQSKNV
jgi:hypothetical protein